MNQAIQIEADNNRVSKSNDPSICFRPWGSFRSLTGSNGRPADRELGFGPLQRGAVWRTTEK